VASGLFDGVRFYAELPVGSLSAGLLYTGLLYKETAKIIMTGGDAQEYGDLWAWDNFGAYFASKRLMASARLNIPFGEANTLSVEAIAQFDLNGNDDALHSQYAEVQALIYPMSTMGITVAGFLEAMEGENGFGAAFGALARLRIDIPGPLNDWMNFTVKFTSGSWNDTFTSFTPVSSITQGFVFAGTQSGFVMISADYNVRIISTLLAEAALRHFMRTYNDPAEKGNLYGGELYMSLVWQPLEDIRLSFGAGAFFPGLGNMEIVGDKVKWKLNAVLSLSF